MISDMCGTSLEEMEDRDLQKSSRPAERDPDRMSASSAAVTISSMSFNTKKECVVISRGANRLILLSDIKCKFAVSHAKNCSSSKCWQKNIISPRYINH